MENLDVNKIWQNFVDTITNHYMDFSGRVGRTQYWWYVGVAVLVSIVASIVASFSIHLISTLVSLALLLPNLGMTARRLQDTGRPGNWVFILAIPFVLELLIGLMTAMLFFASPFGGLFFLLTVGPLVMLLALVAAVALIYLCIQPGQPDANQYGPVPPDWTPNK